MSKQDIDIGLAVLEAVSPAGVIWSQADIAYCCNCSKSAIHQIEKKALAKSSRKIGAA